MAFFHKKLPSFFCLTAAAIAMTVQAGHEDPYSNISHQKLENGLVIVLAPSSSARTVEVELQVQTGWNEEDSSNRGVAHLMEHLAFRDSSLPYHQNYIQRIREAGGEVNTATTATYTSFFASVPSIRGIWVLNEFASLSLGRKFTEQDIEKAKSDALLELGESEDPLPAILRLVIPRLSKSPDFFSTEFGVVNPIKTEIEKIRRSTKNLTLEQIQAFYDRFYVPNNITLIVAGPFKKDATLSFIKETFERYPIVLPEEKLQNEPYYARPQPYHRSKVASRKSRITIGTKFWDITQEDEIVLKLYLDYLANRVTKQLRTETGETFNAESKVWVDERRFGFAFITFETTNQNFRKNLNYVKRLIWNETVGGNFSDNAIQQARNLYYQYLPQIEKDPATLVKLASRLYSFQRRYGGELTPHSVFMKLSNAEFREHLRGVFHPSQEYLYLEEPPLTFRGEALILYLLTALFSLLLGRRLFLKRFDYVSLRYVRKIRYQPVVVVVLLILFVDALWLVSQTMSIIDDLLLSSQIVQSTFILSEYLLSALMVFALVLAAISYFCLIPRKLIVTQHHIYIKSLSYASHKIEIRQLRDLFVCRPHNIFFNRLWNWKIILFHWTPWRKGILLRLKNGRGYYLSFTNAQKVAEELHEVLLNKESYHYHDAA